MVIAGKKTRREIILSSRDSSGSSRNYTPDFSIPCPSAAGFVREQYRNDRRLMVYGLRSMMMIIIIIIVIIIL